MRLYVPRDPLFGVSLPVDAAWTKLQALALTGRRSLIYSPVQILHRLSDEDAHKLASVFLIAVFEAD